MKSLRLLLVLLSSVLLFLGCAKEKSFEVNNGLTNSRWEFSEGSNFFKGDVDTVYKNQVAPGVTAMVIEGTSDDGTGTITLGVIGINTTAPGTYKTPNVLFDYTKASGTLYQNDIGAVDQFTIEITKIDSASVSGIFTGKAKDSSGALKTITSGKFNGRFGSSGTPQPGTAQITLWSKAGCGGGGTGPISVKLSNGQTGSVTSFSATAPACGAAGVANFTVPAGTYAYEAICGTDTLRGVVTAAANQCLKQELTFAPAGPAALYSLISMSGVCSSQVKGTYYVGKVLSPDTNTIVTPVNVTQVGTYSITTNSLNGYSFSTSGTFTTTGPQFVTLKSAGTPIAAGTNNFTLTGGTSNCSAAVTVLPLPPGATTNSWSFTEGTKNFSGTFEGPGLFDDDVFGFGKALDLFGSIPGTDTLIEIYIQFPASATEPIPGTYITDPVFGTPTTSDFYLFNLTTGEDYYYVRDIILTPPPPNVKLTIIITSYDPLTKIVKGTFSGTAWNKAGAIVNITNGKFEGEVEF